MIAEVGRNIADAQTAVGIGMVGVGLDELGERLGMLVVPAPSFLTNSGGIVAGVKGQLKRRLLCASA